MTRTTPRDAVADWSARPDLVDGDDERFTGYGVMGVPFASGHYLALRDMVASSVGPAYRAVWHRTPEGQWTIYTTAAPELSCPRYFGAVSRAVRVGRIEVTWSGDYHCDVTVDQDLSWRIELGATAATRLMTSIGTAMPLAAWDDAAVLASMGPMARIMLRSGRIRLGGRAPSGARFRVAPLQVWPVVGGGATVRGQSLGTLAPLAEQARLTDMWLPQRGLFFIGRARFSVAAIGSLPSVMGAAS